MAKRIQRKRTKGWQMPENAVYVGRPTKWGNPYRIGRNYADGEHDEIPYDNIDAETAVRWYREAIENGISTAVNLTVEEIKNELGGKDLACWCALDQPCHADVLLEIANAQEIAETGICSVGHDTSG